MTKVKILTSVASDSFSYFMGEVADIDPKLAKHFVKIGIAEEIEEPKTIAKKLKKVVEVEGDK